MVAEEQAGPQRQAAPAGGVTPPALLPGVYGPRPGAAGGGGGGLPRHVGVILDGNRRWARELGMGSAEGHRRGAAQIDHLLAWARELGIPVVTLWLLSTENLLQRHPDELAELLAIIEAKVVQLASDAAPDGYRVVPVGQLEALPERTRSTLQAAAAAPPAAPGGGPPGGGGA